MPVFKSKVQAQIFTKPSAASTIKIQFHIISFTDYYLNFPTIFGLEAGKAGVSKGVGPGGMFHITFCGLIR